MWPFRLDAEALTVQTRVNATNINRKIAKGVCQQSQLSKKQFCVL